MSQRIVQLGIAVASAIAVIGIFFIFNPFTSMQDTSATSEAADSTNQADGLVVQDSVVGTGATAQSGDLVTVNYTGKLSNGSVFDTSVGKTPFKFTLGVGQVISGWDQGVAGMKVGGKRTLIIPPALAYGAQGVGPIPPNSTLTFEVELVSVESAGTAPAAQ